MKPFVLLDVAPIDEREGLAFVDYADKTKSGVELLKFKVYPDSPRGVAFREHRVGRGGMAHVKLYELARAMGISSADVSSLERGAMTFADEGDWQRAMAVIDEVRAKKGGA